MLKLFVPFEMKTVAAGLSAVLLLTLVVAAPPAQASACALDGAGTLALPYKIASEADFEKVGVGDCADNAHYLLTGPVELAATYDQSVVAGTFQGVFDGGGFTISGMRIEMNGTTTTAEVGFFARVDGGTVKNVIFDAPHIDVTVDRVGVVVGRLDAGSVEDVTVREPKVTGDNEVGGIVGQARHSVTLEDVRVIGGEVTGNFRVGGVVGELRVRARNEHVEATFRNLASSANVTGTRSNVGGIAGLLTVDAMATLDAGNCPNTKPDQSAVLVLENVHVRETANVVNNDGPTGGLVGRIETYANCDGTSATTRILDSSVSAEVEGTSNTAGLVGLLATSDGAPMNIELARVRFDGTVTASGSESAGLVGGLASGVGVDAIIEDVTVVGSISGTRELGGIIGKAGLRADGRGSLVIRRAAVSGTVMGTNDVGGIAGYPEGEVTIEQSSFSGTVMGTNDVGGIAGEQRSGAIVRDVIVRGRVQGSGQTGGIAGYLNSGSGTTFLPTTVERAVGIVEVVDTAANTGLAFGSVSETRTFVAHVRVATDVAGSTTDDLVGEGSDGGVTGNTQAELRLLATYVGWPMVQGWVPADPAAGQVWGICRQVNDGFPFLLWRHTADPCVDPAPTTAPAPADVEGTLSCSAPVVGVGSVCVLTATPDQTFVWEASTNPVFATGEVRTDASGVGEFSFAVAESLLGSEIVVQVIGVADSAASIGVASQIEGTLSCSAPVVGVGSVCVLTATPDQTFVWEASTNPVFASGEVRTDASGVGEFSFAVAESQLGSEIVVQVIGVAETTGLVGIASPPVPSAVPAGEGPPGWHMVFGLVLAVGLLAAALLAFGGAVPVGRRTFRTGERAPGLCARSDG